MLDVQSAPTITGVTESWSAPTPSMGSGSVYGSRQALKPGAVLAGRYEILQLLGVGGMGEVYKARDRELDRLVALKIIRPELAGNQEILRRFKQELLLARQVTHKNVIRIFDLGQDDGTKFISMEYVEGQDLKALMDEKGKFTPEQAVGIIQQVCYALDAAHAEGVIHRDLKPRNIMLDKKGKVLVMDFGIARSMEVPGMTQTGALVGTPEYVSPEQARGEKLDSRSDLFTLGIIFYELLTGKAPFQAETTLASLLKRISERAVPPVQLDPTIPLPLSDLVVKCLEIDRERRYQNAMEILQDLDTIQGKSPRMVVATLLAFLRRTEPPWKWMVTGLAALLLAIVLFVFREKILFRPAAKLVASVEPISLAILPFRNASGDPTLDWLGPSLAEILRTEVGQSSYLRTVSSDRLHQILRDLGISGDAIIDPATLRRLAEFSNAETVMWGQYIRLGSEIRIDATLQDVKRLRTVSLKAQAANESGLLTAIGQLAQSIRENLALSPYIVKELQAKSFIPSSKSILALRYYNEGLQLARQGKYHEAAKKFEASTQEDEEFALAYSKLGQTYSSLGYDSEAEKFSQKAVSLSETLPPQERYLVQANHARIVHDNQKAIESYENLAKVLPDSDEVLFDLAGLYEDRGSFDLARDRYAKLLARDPKYLDALISIGRVEIRAGNAKGSFKYMDDALTLAFQLVQLEKNDEQYARILHSMGVAYQQLNRPEEALRFYQQSLGLKRRIGQQKRGIAVSLNMIGQVQEVLGKSEQALASYKEALQLRREIGDNKGIGETLNDLGAFYQDRGQYDQALKLFKESLKIQRDMDNENYEAVCLSNLGNVYLAKGDYDNALTNFERALQLREKFKVSGDIPDILHNLAETFTKMGQYDQALARYLQALEQRRSAGDRKGAAIESYSMGTLFEYQGRNGAAVKSKEEALMTFRELRDRSFWLAEILSGYGSALNQVGRAEEGQKILEEALGLARDLQNEPLIAQTLNFQADGFFYGGDFRSARALYEQASQMASRTTDRYLVLVSRANLAKTDVKEGRPQAAIKTLRKLVEESDALGLKYLSVECSISLAEALLNSGDYSRARQEVERALIRSEKLGLRTLLAKSHYLLATVLRLTKNGADSQRHHEAARRILDEIRKEAGSDDILKRADLSPIYAGSARP